MFRDITTLLGDARAFRRAIDELVQPWAGAKIDKVAGMEARGFILGGAVAHQLSAGFVPIRKKGKLPHTKVSIAYSLEYGLDEMEMHQDAVVAGERVILVDDLIATGGTATGAVGLLKKIGADVVAACFVIDLPDLGGADKIRALGVPVRTLDELSGALTNSPTPLPLRRRIMYMIMSNFGGGNESGQSAADRSHHGAGQGTRRTQGRQGRQDIDGGIRPPRRARL